MLVLKIAFKATDDYLGGLTYSHLNTVELGDNSKTETLPELTVSSSGGSHYASQIQPVNLSTNQSTVNQLPNIAVNQNSGYIVNKPVDTDPTVGLESQVVDYINSLAAQSSQYDTNELKRQRIQGMIDYQHPERLKNDDFYVQTSPLVAGSISGRIIGTQLITGGGDAVRMPMAPYQYERERLLNTILNSIKPLDRSKQATTQNDQWSDIKAPDAGIYNEKFKDIYMSGADKFEKVASRVPGGYKLLHTKGNPLNDKYASWNTNMTYLANNLTSAVKTADALATKADEYGLTLPRDVRKKIDRTRFGLMSILNGENPDVNIQKSLKEATLGMSAVQVVKDIKDQTIAQVQTQIENATKDYGLNPNVQKYHDVLREIKTTSYLNPEQYYQEKGIDSSKATKEDYNEALRYNAKLLVKPRVESEYGDINDDDAKEVFSNSVEMVYQQLKNTARDIDLKTIGSTPIQVSAKATIAPEKTIEIPQVGSVQQTVLDITANGHGTGANGTKYVITPNGNIEAYTPDGKYVTLNPNEPKSLTTSMITLEGGKNIDEVKNMILQHPEMFESLNVSIKKAKEGFVDFESWHKKQYPKSNVTAETASINDYAEYLNNNPKASLIINGDAIRKIKLEKTNKDNIYKFYFQTVDGRDILPAYTQQEAIEKKATKTSGSNTTGVWVSSFPTKNMDGAKALYNAKTGELDIYTADSDTPVSSSKIDVYKSFLKNRFKKSSFPNVTSVIETEHAINQSQSGKNVGTGNNATVGKKEK